MGFFDMFRGKKIEDKMEEQDDTPVEEDSEEKKDNPKTLTLEQANDWWNKLSDDGKIEIATEMTDFEEDDTKEGEN